MTTLLLRASELLKSVRVTQAFEGSQRRQGWPWRRFFTDWYSLEGKSGAPDWPAVRFPTRPATFWQSIVQNYRPVIGPVVAAVARHFAGIQVVIAGGFLMLVAAATLSKIKATDPD